MSQTDAGMLPRAIDRLFVGIQLAQQHGAASGHEVTCEVRCSFLEVYNDDVRDLLNPCTPSSRIQIRSACVLFWSVLVSTCQSWCADEMHSAAYACIAAIALPVELLWSVHSSLIAQVSAPAVDVSAACSTLSQVLHVSASEACHSSRQ